MLSNMSEILMALMVIASTFAAPVEIIVEGQTLVEFETIQCENANKNHGLKPICPHLKTVDKGCIRCTYLNRSGSCVRC